MNSDFSVLTPEERKEIGQAAIRTAETYLDWANIQGEEANRNVYLNMARQNLAVARACGYQVGLLCDGNPYDYRKD